MIKRWLGVLLWAVIMATLSASGGEAQLAPTGGQVVTPGSSIEKPGDVGVRAHTNIKLFTPNRAPPGPPSPSRSGAADNARSVKGTGDTNRPQ